MMKRIIVLVAICLIAFTTNAQTQARKEFGTIYNPEANAREDINQAIATAKKEHKNVLLQIGGNWCIWCIRFHNLVQRTDSLKALMDNNYITVHVNYEKKNAGDALWKELGYPQRFGFPVFVVLDENGNRVHTQNSAYLEEADGHSAKKVAAFLQDWTPAAMSGN